jgi:tetratricopeptide (TPR) repeat protein
MKLTIKSLFVLVCVIAAGVQVKAQGTQQAIGLLDSEQFSKAQDMLEKQIAAAPTADNQFALGYFFVRRGQLDKAKEAFDKGAVADPKNMLVKIGQGMVLMGNKKYSEAKTLIDAQVAASKMKNADVLYRAAEAYSLFEHTNDPAEAVRLIDLIAEKTKKTAAEYQIVKGDAFLIKNDGGPAVSAYEQALLLQPNNARAMVSIGKVFKRGKNYKLAQEGYTRAILADTNYAPAYREFGELWLLARQYKNAAYNYDKYIVKAEPTCENKLRYVKLAFLAKNYEGARRMQKQVEECMGNAADLKNDLDIPRMKGYMAYEEGKPEEAIKQLTDLLAKLPADKVIPSDKGILARSYQKANNDAKALDYLNQVAPIDTNENYYVNIHDIHYKNKKYEDAAQATIESMKWTADRKEGEKSNDLITLTRDYYFASQAIKLDTNSVKADTLRRVDLAQKADNAMAALQSKRGDYVPSHLWRARALGIVDADKTKGLAVPHYIKYTELAEKEREKNKNELKEAYTYLAFNSLIYSPVKDEIKGKEFINKVLEIDPENATIKRYLQATAPVTPPPAATTTAPVTKPGATTTKPGTAAKTGATSKPATTKPKGK